MKWFYRMKRRLQNYSMPKRCQYCKRIGYVDDEGNWNTCCLPCMHEVWEMAAEQWIGAGLVAGWFISKLEQPPRKDWDDFIDGYRSGWDDGAEIFQWDD